VAAATAFVCCRAARTYKSGSCGCRTPRYGSRPRINVASATAILRSSASFVSSSMSTAPFVSGRRMMRPASRPPNSMRRSVSKRRLNFPSALRAIARVHDVSLASAMRRSVRTARSSSDGGRGVRRCLAQLGESGAVGCGDDVAHAGMRGALRDRQRGMVLVVQRDVDARHERGDEEREDERQQQRHHRARRRLFSERNNTAATPASVTMPETSAATMPTTLAKLR
jgi:hypothetical protein